MTQKRLWQLRRQIPLCSLFYSDYRNSFDIDEHAVCDFFDGYADYLAELMNEDCPGRGNNFFYDYLEQYDTSENLWNWYCCFEEEPLPKMASEQAA